MTKSSEHRYDLKEIAASFPDVSDSMLMDTYIKDTPEASVRIFRVYHAIPPHFHRDCDEVLQVLEGEGTFWIGTPEDKTPFKPGQLIVFPRLAVHAVTSFIKQPVVFLAIDTPRRAPDDVVFINADEAKRKFVEQVKA